MNKAIAIIGNRYGVPEEVIKYLEELGYYLGSMGFTLNSGGATGCDQAGERGFDKGNFPKNIRKAKHATPEAIELASKYHDAWYQCTDYVRQLHGRNSMIILGDDLKTPVEAVICYAVSEIRGGTALGIKIARDYGIPVFNLAKRNHGLDKFIENLKKDQVNSDQFNGGDYPLQYDSMSVDELRSRLFEMNTDLTCLNHDIALLAKYISMRLKND